MIIDSHTHIVKIPNTDLPSLSFKQIIERLRDEMKSSGVDHVCVLPYFEHDDTEFGAPDVEALIELAKDFKNMHVLGSLNVTNHTKAHLDRLNYLLEKKLIKGIKLYPGYQHFYPEDDIVAPLYKLCIKHNAPVLFHSGDTYSTKNQARVKYSHPLHFDELAYKFPDLKIIIAHVGNPWTTDCAEMIYKNKNVYADISGLVVLQKLNSSYGKLMQRRIQELALDASPEKLLFGTDWPLSDMKQYIEFTKNLGFSKKDLECIFYKNAVTLFAIETK